MNLELIPEQTMLVHNMMVEPLHYCLFLPVSLLAALCTDTVVRSKFVCIGDTVDLFRDNSSSNMTTDIEIFKTFEQTAVIIASRHMLNFSYEDKIEDKYKRKVSWENTALVLRDFQKSDEAKYVMKYNYSTQINTVDICALVPPTLKCKLDIQQKEKFLIASLDNPEYCGKPLASVRWMGYPHISVGNTAARMQLPSVNKPGTYIACIVGDALKCITESPSWDNCRNYTIDLSTENTSPTVVDLPKLTYALIGMVASVIFGVIAILIKLFWKHLVLLLRMKYYPRDQERPGDDYEAADERAEDVPLQTLEYTENS